MVKRKERELRVSNLAGQEVYNSVILPGRANHELSTGNWHEGLYIFRLFEEGELVQTEKVLVVK